MRKVVAYELLSLDGVAEEPDEFIAEWDEEMSANLKRVIDAQDAVILGRTTYDLWAKFWPGSAIEPFSTFINGTKKYVATSTPLGDTWSNSDIIDGDLAPFVSRLKEQPGGDIGIHGSIAIAQALLEADLVDELSLVIAPSIHLHGRKLLDKARHKKMALTRSAASPSGYLMVDYSLNG